MQRILTIRRHIQVRQPCVCVCVYTFSFRVRFCTNAKRRMVWWSGFLPPHQELLWRLQRRRVCEAIPW